MARLERVIAESRAQLAGVKAEYAALADVDAPKGRLVELDRTDAIEAVLRQSSGTMNVQEIIDALKAGGRTDDPTKSVRATLSYLQDAGRVTRVSRGQYTAA